MPELIHTQLNLILTHGHLVFGHVCSAHFYSLCYKVITSLIQKGKMIEEIATPK